MKDIIAIENVQRRATKYMPTLKVLSYEDILRKLQLPTLRCRRLQGDMIEVFKILKGKYDKTVADFLPLQQDSSTSLPTRGHSLRLRAEKGVRQNFHYTSSK